VAPDSVCNTIRHVRCHALAHASTFFIVCLTSFVRLLCSPRYIAA
jgi:hypothetical protein